MKALAVILSLLVLSLSAHAEDALKTLAAIPSFAFDGIGAAGTISQGEVAFRQVLERDSARDDFLSLLKTGNAQAKCYALVALRSLDRQVYSERVEKFKKDKTSVSTIGGCMISVLPMASVVSNIDTGRYDGYLTKDRK